MLYYIYDFYSVGLEVTFMFIPGKAYYGFSFNANSIEIFLIIL